MTSPAGQRQSPKKQKKMLGPFPRFAEEKTKHLFV